MHARPPAEVRPQPLCMCLCVCVHRCARERDRDGVTLHCAQPANHTPNNKNQIGGDDRFFLARHLTSMRLWQAAICGPPSHWRLHCPFTSFLSCTQAAYFVIMHSLVCHLFILLDAAVQQNPPPPTEATLPNFKRPHYPLTWALQCLWQTIFHIFFVSLALQQPPRPHPSATLHHSLHRKVTDSRQQRKGGGGRGGGGEEKQREGLMKTTDLCLPILLCQRC